jgi:molecular chaperone DnaK
VHVSAKDLGTGNEQKITITASTNLSEAEIDRAVKEAEKHAAEDKKKKEIIEAKNQADSLIYQTEKTLKELGDKVDPADKSNIEAELNNLKEVVKSDDADSIKAASEKLSQAFYAVSQKMYQQNPENAGGFDPGAGADAGPGTNAGQDDVYDADYKVVDDDDK